MNQVSLTIFFVVCDNIRTRDQLEDAYQNGRELAKYCQQKKVPLPSLWLSSSAAQAVKAGFAITEGTGGVIDEVITAPELSVLVLDQHLLAKGMSGKLLWFLDRYLQTTTHPPPHFSVAVSANRAWIEPGVAFLLLPDAAAATREAVAAKCFEKFAPGIPKRPIIVLSAVADLGTREFNFSGFDRIGAFADEYIDPNLTSNVRLVAVSDQDNIPTAKPEPKFTSAEQAWMNSEPDADPPPEPKPPGFWQTLTQLIFPTK